MIALADSNGYFTVRSNVVVYQRYSIDGHIDPEIFLEEDMVLLKLKEPNIVIVG